MIKALFFDLDGTLLTSSKKMSDKTKEALAECREKGIKVFAATARPPLLSRMIGFSKDELLLLRDGGVFQNGGCLCIGDSKIYTFLPEETVTECIRLTGGYAEVNLVVQLQNERHCFRYGLSEVEYGLWGVGPDKLVSFGDLTCDCAVKIVVFYPWSLLEELHDKLVHSISTAANVYLTGRSDFRSIEIVGKNINKKLGIDRIVELCGLNRDEVAVFGDDNNDIEMLKGFENSIAMGNACEEAKACAAHVTLGNDEEGIYHALKNILGLI